jgi:hypothetical protein
VEKYGKAGEAKDDNIVRNMRIACWIPKATNAHSEYVMLIASTPKKMGTLSSLNATLPVL